MQRVTRRASSDGRGAPPMMSSRRGMSCQDTNTRLTFSLSVAFTTTLPSTCRYLTSRRVCKWGKRWCERNGIAERARSLGDDLERRLHDDLVSRRLRLPGETHRVRCGREHGLHGLRKHGPLLDQHFLLVRCCVATKFRATNFRPAHFLPKRVLPRERRHPPSLHTTHVPETHPAWHRKGGANSFPARRRSRGLSRLPFPFPPPSPPLHPT
jgi:hypothetical protein